jgi:hypothetical protein
MKEEEVSAFLNLMHTTHNISITFTPIGEKRVDANANAPAPAITEERVLELIREHTATASDALKESITEAIEEKFTDYDFSDAVESAVDDAISSKDWDYELREAIDWDRAADKVMDKLDWETALSDNNVLTSNDIDVDDIMLKSDTLSDDEKISRGDLGDEVSNQLKRDWFKTMLEDEIKKYVLEKQLPTLVAKAIHQLFVRASDYAVEVKKNDETSNLQ